MNDVKTRKLSYVLTALDIRLEGVDNQFFKKLEIGDLGCYFEQDVDKDDSEKSVNKKTEDCKKFFALFHVCAIYDGFLYFCFEGLLDFQNLNSRCTNFILICMTTVQNFVRLKSSKCLKMAVFRFSMNLPNMPYQCRI